LEIQSAITISKSSGNYWFIEHCACFLQAKILFKLKKIWKLPVLCKQVLQWEMHRSAWISEPPHVDLGRPNRFSSPLVCVRQVGYHLLLFILSTFSAHLCCLLWMTQQFIRQRKPWASITNPTARIWKARSCDCCMLEVHMLNGSAQNISPWHNLQLISMFLANSVERHAHKTWAFKDPFSKVVSGKAHFKKTLEVQRA